jgi:uncharacterized RDD family membrane protein YckC
MKCPKCGYLGFEQVDRCRNCGYEFSLQSSSAIGDLPVRIDTPVIGPLADLPLVDAAAAPQPSRFSAEIGLDVERVFDRPQPPEPGASELPLFGSPTSDDTPLITKPSPPRPPLAVRRSTADVPRARAGPIRAASLDLALDLDGPVAAHTSVGPAGAAQAQEGLARPVGTEPAGLGARAAAVAIDLLLLAAIDAAVVYFTMQICGVTIQELAIIPQGPLGAFLVVQNVGYLVAFTAGGQTLGKMAAGIKVVAAESDRPIDVGQALKRTVAWLLLAIPAGLGFLTALASRDRRGLHDRLAGTRVVRASA